MKKTIKYLFLLFIFLPFVVNAKTINDFACDYNIKCDDPINYTEVDLGYVKIMYKGFNDGNYENGTLSVFYGEAYDASKFVSITPGEKFTGFKNYKFGDKNRKMIILQEDTDGDMYALNFKDTKLCNPIYCSVNDTNVYVTTASQYTSGFNTSNKELKPLATFYRNSEENKWLKNTEFNSQPSGGSSGGSTPTTTPKEPLVCTYNVTPKGEYYDVGMNTDGSGETAKVELTTYYDPNTGNPLSYNITVNGSSPLTNIKSFDSNVEFEFTGAGSTQQYKLIVEPEQLKKLFPGSCVENIYLYMHKDGAIAGTYAYYLTTNATEAADNVLNEDFDHNDTGKGDGKYEVVELDPDSTPMTCSEILGEPLLTIVKGGITIVQIAAAIIAIVKGMLLLVPAITAKDADGLKKASKTLAILAVILALVVIFRPLVKMIGKLLDYDVSCIV